MLAVARHPWRNFFRERPVRWHGSGAYWAAEGLTGDFRANGVSPEQPRSTELSLAAPTAAPRRLPRARHGSRWPDDAADHQRASTPAPTLPRTDARLMRRSVTPGPTTKPTADRYRCADGDADGRAPARQPRRRMRVRRNRGHHHAFDHRRASRCARTTTARASTTSRLNRG